MGRATLFAYSGANLSAAGGTTTITDPDGDVTVEDYQNGELTSLTQGYGTTSAATTAYSYADPTLGPTSVVDPDGHTTTYTYDAHGDVLTKDRRPRQDLDLYLQLARRGAQLPDPRPGRRRGRDDQHLRRRRQPVVHLRAPPRAAAPPPPPTRTARAAPPRATLAT